MKKVLSLLISTILLLSGCDIRDGGNMERDVTYDAMMLDAISSISEGEYEKARTYLECALEDIPGDLEATNLTKKLDILISISKEVNDIDSVILKLDEAEKIKSINTSSTVVDDKVNERITELVKYISTEIDIIEQDISEGDYEICKNLLEDILDKCSKYDVLFDEQIKRCEQLIDKIKGL